MRKLIEELEWARYNLTSSKGKETINKAIDMLEKQQTEIEKLKFKNKGLEHKVIATRVLVLNEFWSKLVRKATSIFYEEHMYIAVEDGNDILEEMTKDYKVKMKE